MFEFFGEQDKNPQETRTEHLQAAAELAAEIMPQLKNYPATHNHLTQHLENDFVDDEGQELDAGEILSRIQDVMDRSDRTLSAKFICPVDGSSFPEVEPRLFSFNSPYGACPECNGLGMVGIDPGFRLWW